MYVPVYAVVFRCHQGTGSPKRGRSFRDLYRACTTRNGPSNMPCHTDSRSRPPRESYCDEGLRSWKLVCCNRQHAARAGSTPGSPLPTNTICMCVSRNRPVTSPFSLARFMLSIICACSLFVSRLKENDRECPPGKRRAGGWLVFLPGPTLLSSPIDRFAHQIPRV